MATVEFALVIPALIAILVMCLGAIQLGVNQIRVTDAARAGARAASRGESSAVVRAIVRDAAPDGAVVSVSVGVDTVTVVVEAPGLARSVGPLEGLHVSASATAVREESVGSGGAA